jgi:hypothetical protein
VGFERRAYIVVPGYGIGNRVIITVAIDHTLGDAIISEVDVLESAGTVDLHRLGYIVRPAPDLED